MRFFDTHCHFDLSQFNACRSQVVAACQRLGVERLLVPGVYRDQWQTLSRFNVSGLELDKAYGMHPCFLSKHNDDDICVLERLIEAEAPVAIGEIGLDFWDTDADKSTQISLFESQLDLAVKYRLPVILHSRKSHDQLVSRLRKKQITRGMVHGFSGSWQQASAFVDQGLKIGLGGALTYPRAQKLQAIARQLPLDAIVLETDAPDMPICGRQGRINRPDYLPEIFEVLVGLRSEPPELLAEALWNNSQQLFSARN